MTSTTVPRGAAGDLHWEHLTPPPRQPGGHQLRRAARTPAGVGQRDLLSVGVAAGAHLVRLAGLVVVGLPVVQPEHASEWLRHPLILILREADVTADVG